ncbi:MAG: histidine kinase [Lachnospiraceae bacterium]|nr:histidine kinase [Lachnospiraceae bacterium]
MRKTSETKAPKIDGMKSLVTGLRLIMGLIVVVMAVSFFIAVLYLVRQERLKTINNEAERTLNALEDGISGEIEKYKELSRLMMIDEDLVEYLKADASDVDAVLRNKARYSILATLNITTMVDSVFAFRNDGLYINTSRDIYDLNLARMEDPEWLEDISERMGGAAYSINGNGAIIKRNGTPLVSIGRTIYDIQSQEKLGTMFLNILDTSIARKIDVIGGKNLIAISEDGLFLSGNRDLQQYLNPSEYTEEIKHEMIRGRVSKLMISACRVKNTPIIIAYASEIGTEFVMFEAVKVLTAIIFTFLFILILAGTYLTKNVTTPITELTKAMHHNKETGRLEQIDIAIPDNEIGLLKDSYNGMVERVNSLFSKLLENEQTIRRAEMRVLHEQIKPHFLYNSLETIGYLAMDAGADNVHSALETLGSFYRNFLSKGDREIPFEREINIVKDYLSLQKLRYGDIIEDEYDIEEETKSFIIPKLILQPIVENSIYHGIRLTGEKGTITIKSRIIVDDLHIWVRDTGVGMTEEQIEKVMAGDTGEELEPGGVPSESFGLWGTVERIRYFCGKRDVVRIRSEVGEYTEIEFIIPRRE